jgi:hypothetical protein
MLVSLSCPAQNLPPYLGPDTAVNHVVEGMVLTGVAVGVYLLVRHLRSRHDKTKTPEMSAPSPVTPSNCVAPTVPTAVCRPGHILCDTVCK